MTNVIVLGIVGAFIILLGAAYRQSKKTRQELIAEMEEEILSNEPAPVEAPAPVVAKAEKAVKSAPVEPTPVVEEVAVVPAPVVEEVVAPAPVEVKEVKAAVQEMVATQEAPAPKPRNNRRRGRPGKKQENSSTK
jgi:septal ring-binding cell division protein DamX